MQPRHLHGERRAAGDDVAAGADELARGAHHAPPVDAAMLGEAPVLVGDEHVEEARIDVGLRHRQAPAAVGDGEGAEQRPSRSTTMRPVSGVSEGSSTFATAYLSARGAAGPTRQAARRALASRGRTAKPPQRPLSPCGGETERGKEEGCGSVLPPSLPSPARGEGRALCFPGGEHGRPISAGRPPQPCRCPSLPAAPAGTSSSINAAG